MSKAVVHNNKAYAPFSSQRVRPKDAIDLAKQAGVVYKIPHGGGKVFIGGGGRPTQERFKNTTGISDPPTIEEVWYVEIPMICKAQSLEMMKEKKWKGMNLFLM